MDSWWSLFKLNVRHQMLEKAALPTVVGLGEDAEFYVAQVYTKNIKNLTIYINNLNNILDIFKIIR